MTDRKAFEAFITAPPFERSASRFDDRGSWPGSYINYETDLAWRVWQAAIALARATAPAWQDAPTEPGLWVCFDEMSGAFTCDITLSNLPAACVSGERWYGPIPDGNKENAAMTTVLSHIDAQAAEIETLYRVLNIYDTTIDGYVDEIRQLKDSLDERLKDVVAQSMEIERLRGDPIPEDKP